MKNTVTILKNFALITLLFFIVGYANGQTVVNMTNAGTIYVDVCTSPSGTIYDDGGVGSNYSHYFDGWVVLTAPQGVSITLSGTYSTESCCDKIKIYDGEGESGNLLVNNTSGSGSINVSSQTGYLSIKFHTDGSVNNSGFELQWSISGTGATCNNEIDDLVVSNITTSSADLSWTATNTTDSFYVYLNNSEYFVTTTNSLSLTNLTPNTFYDIVVVSTSDIGSECCYQRASFRTPCTNTMLLPYAENFDNYDISSGNVLPNCWTKLVNFDMPEDEPHVTHNTSYTGDGSLYLYCGSNDAMGHFALAITPYLSDDDISQHYIRFKLKSPTANTIIEVGICDDTTLYDNNFTPITTFTTTSSNTWQDCFVSLASYTGTGRYIAFRMIRRQQNGNGRIAYIDNLVVENCGITNPRLLNRNFNTLSIEWNTHGNPSVNVEIGPAGFLPGTGTIYTNVTSPLTVSNLEPATDYEFHIYPICVGAALNGEQMHTLTARTLETPIYRLNYCENFDTYSDGNYPPAWRRMNMYNGTPRVVSIYSNSLQMMPNYQNTMPIAIMPAIDSVNFDDLILSFDYRMDYTESILEVGIMEFPEDEANFVPIDTIRATYSSTAYMNATLFLNTYNGIGRYIAFRVSDPRNYYAYVYVDNIKVSKCHINGAAVTDVRSESLTLIWDSINSYTPNDSIRIIYGPETNFDDSTIVLIMTINEFTINNGIYSTNITGLRPNTNYLFYVEPICSGVINYCETPIRVRTLSQAYTMPFCENFESYPNSSFPEGWSKPSEHDGRPYTDTRRAYNSSSSLNVHAYGDLNYFHSTVSFPYINFDNIRSLYLSFYGYGTRNISYIEAGVMVNPNDETTFVPTDTIILSNGSWKKFIMNFASYTGNGNYIALRYYHNCNTCHYEAWIDDISINNCLINNIRHYSTSSRGTTIAWDTVGNYSGVVIEFGPDNFVVGTGTKDTIYNQTTFTIDTLTPGTTYDYVIYSLCQGGNSDCFSTRNSFSTLETALEASYCYGFEDFPDETYPRPSSWTTPLYCGAEPRGERNGYEGTWSLYFRCSSWESENNRQSMAVMPLLEMDDLSNISLSFYAKGSGNNNTPFVVGNITIPNDVSTFVPIDTFYINHNDYRKYTVDLSSCTNLRHIAFWHYPVGNTSGTVYIDNLLLSSCSIENIRTSLTTTTTTVINFETISFVDSVDLEYGPRGFSLGSGTKITDISSPYTLTGLTPGTAYSYYLLPHCTYGNGICENYSGTFTTISTGGGVSNTFCGDFENVSEGGLPSHWQRVSSLSTSYPRVASSPYNVNYPNSEKALCFQNNSMIVLPIAMQSLEELIVSFDAVCRDSYYPENSMFVVGVMTNPSDASSFEALDTIVATYNYSRHNVSLFGYQGEGRYIAIKNIDSHSRQCSYIDNISTSICTPINIETSRITANSLQLSWNRMNYTDTTIILYDTLGGNISANGIFIRTNDTVVRINNLLEGKTYQFYVYALCQDDMPRCQYTSLTASTLPTSNVVPACFNFDSEIIEQMPAYWIRPYGSIYPRVYSNSYHSQTQSLEFYVGNEHYNPMAVMPFLETNNLTSDSISMSLNVRNQYDGDCYLIIGTMTNPNDSSTFSYIDTLRVSNYWEAKQLMIPVHENEDGIYIAFKACPPSGNTVYVDDIAIRECDIISARVHRPTKESLNVSWIGVPESVDVKIEYSVVGSLDEEFAGSPDTVVYATQCPFTLSWLEHSTYYRLHIYPTCDSVSDGCHYRSYSGQTLHPPVDIPYCENFDAFENDGYPNNWRYLSEHSNCNPHITTSTYQSEQGSLELTALHGYSSYAIMPSFNAECKTFGSVYVLPYIKCTDTAGVKLLVGYMTDIYDTNSFVVVDTIDFESTTDWVRYLVVMHNFNKSTMNVAFKMVSNNLYHKFCYIDDLCIEQCLSTNLQITDITQTTATITWDSQGLESLQCEYGPSGFTPGTGTIIQLTESPYTITGLIEGENYDFLFANICACDIIGHSIIYGSSGGGYTGGYGGSGYGGGGITITTQYPSALLPYCENFEEYEINEIPNHWIRITGSSREYPAFTTNNRHSEKASLEFYTQAGSSCYAILPTLGTDEITDAVMTFYAYSSNSYAVGNNARFYVGLVDNPNNPNSFDTIQTISLNSTSQWQKFIVDFSSYTGYSSYIAFKFSPFGNAYSMFIDDLYLSTCAFDNVQVVPNGSQVQVSWIEVQDVSSVSITYCPQGADPNGTDAITEIASNSPVVIDNIESNHGYDFYITPQCSDTIVAECISNLITINHHTNIPYCENFDGYLDNTIPNEWKVVNSRQNSEFPKVETINGERVFTFYPSSGDNYDMVLFPPLAYDDSLNGKYVHLKMEVDNYNRSTLQIGVLPDTNDPRSFVPMANIQPTANNTIQEFVVRLSGYSGPSNRLAIKASVTSGTHWFRTNEFSLTDTPYPINVRVNQPSISTAEILWNKVYDSVYYNVLYTPIGSDDWVSIESDSCKAILTNLLPDTTYKYVLQSRNGEIVECTERTFTTGKYRDLPYCDDFDSYEQYACPNGWSRISNDAYYPRVLSSYGINGSKALDFYGTASPQIFVLPEFDIDSIQFLTLNCQIYSQGYYNYHGVIVGMMTDRNNESTFVPIDTLLHTANNVYEKRSVSFRNYQGVGKNIALKYFYTSNRYYTTNIDNLVIKSCPNVTFSSADGDCIRAEIAQNITPDYFIDIYSEDLEYDTLIHVQANPYYIDNLISNTKYYISTQCDSLIESCDAPIIITTPQIKSLPYCEDFSSYTNNRPPTGWVNYRDGNYNVNDYPYKNGNSHIQFYGSSGNTQYLIMPAIDIDSMRSAELNFNMWSDNYNYTYIVVGVMSNQYDINTFVPIDTIWNTVSSAWQNYNVSFLNYHGNSRFIAFKGINTRNSWYSWYIDDLKISSCPKPKIELRDYNTIVFTIDSSYTPDYWIEYGLENFAQGSTDSVMNEDSTYTQVANGTLIHVTENPFSITGLEENTTYTIYTRCDSTIHTCLPATNVRTSYLQSLPYCEDFSSYSNYIIPTGWVNYRDGNYNVNDYPYRTNYAEIRFYGYSSTTQYFVMPSVDIDSIKNIDLYFDMYSDNYNYTSIVVGVMTNQYDINTFVSIDTLKNTSSFTWQSKHISFKDYQRDGKFIAFKGINTRNSWYSWYIDDLKISSCPKPKIELRDYNTIVFTIDSSYTADYWIEYGLGGFAQGSTDSVMNEDSTYTQVTNGTLIHVTENPFYLTGLEENTTYTIYTRCDSAIHTCLPATNIRTSHLQSLPYCEDFSSYGDYTMPLGWVKYRDGIYNGICSSYNDPFVYANRVHFCGNSSTTQYLITPAFDIDSMQNIDLYFDMQSDAHKYTSIVVGVVSDQYDINTFVPIDTVKNTSSNIWENNYHISLRDYRRNGRFIAFRGLATRNSSPVWRIDNLKISSCPTPDVQLYDYNTVVFTIDSSYTADYWIEYGYQGLEQGNSNTIVNEDSTIIEIPEGTLIHVTENPFYLTDLDTNTTYTFYTRCDSAIYTCLPSIDIKTLFPPVNVPYCENFEKYDDNSMPEKWYSLSTTTNIDYANFNVSTSENHTTDKSLQYECRSNNQLLSILPQIGEDSINGLSMSLYLKTTNDNGYMEVGYMEDPHDFGSFVPVKRLTNTNSEWQRFIISMQDAPTDVRYMAIRAVSTSSSRYYAYIDDIYISNCGANSFEVLNISSNSVTFDWVQVGNPTVTIEYGTPDFIQGSGTTVNVNTLPPFTLSGLENLTDYKFIFTSECIEQPEGYCHPNYSDSTTLFTPAGGTGCIDPTDFTSTNTTLTYGVYNNPYSNEGVLDFGYLDSRSRHTVHYDTTEFDPRTSNLLKTVPEGAEASVRLGNWEYDRSQPQGESITYALYVDTSSFDLIILKYAAVLQDPLHDPTEQPRFTLEILDEDMNVIDRECSAADFIADRNLGWNVASNGVLWKDWTIVGVDMTEFADQIVYIRLTTRDCGEGSHYGYAYFTLNCMMKNIRTEHCGDVESNIFSAPDGFSYRWYTSTDTVTTISTEQSITIEIDNEIYYCECSFADNPSCKFTVSAYNGTRYPLAQFNYNSRFNNCEYEVNFTNTSTVSADGVTSNESGERCETAFWDFGNGETSTNYHASTTYSESGIYVIRLISGIANGTCLDTITDTIVVNLDTIRPTIIADSDVCKGNSITLSVHNALSLRWNTNEVDSIIYKTPISNTDYTCYVKNLKGCADTISHTINVHPYYYYYDTITYCRTGQEIQWRDTVLSANIEAGDYKLIRNSKFGCDSNFYLHLLVSSPVQTFDTANICQNDLPFSWHDTIFPIGTTTGTYVRNHVSRHGCDSTCYLHLVVDTNPHSYFRDTILQNQLPYIWADHTFFEEGIFIDTVDNSVGCDSIITYNLYVYKNVSIVLDSSVCENYLPLIWNGVEFNSTKDTSIILIGAHGVDSSVYMNVTVLRNTTSTIRDTIIENQLPWNYQGVNFTTDITDTTFRIPNTVGCDSIITYSLYVLKNVSTTIDSSICENYLPLVWNGVTFNASGDTSVVLVGEHGVDSTVNMNVTVLRNTTAVRYDTIIENQLPWNYLGANFRTDITDTILIIPNVAGCDSIITYSLYVYRNVSTILDSSICENYLPLIWNGVAFNSTKDTTVILSGSQGIDSAVYMNVTVLPNTTSTIHDTVIENQLPWTYLGVEFTTDISDTTFVISNVSGCDSVITYSLYVHRNVINNLDSSICENYLPLVWNGITFNTSGDTSVVLVGKHGVDSTVNMNITVLQNTTAVRYDTIVENQLPWNYLGAEFETDITDTTLIIPNIAGCDSIISYNLYVYRNVSTTVDSTLCENYLPFIWNGVEFNSTKDTSVVLLGEHGVDSIVYMQVTVLRNTTSTKYDTIIENQLPWSFLGVDFTTNVTDTAMIIPNSIGCDSVISYSLYVHRNVINDLDSSICENYLPLVWNGITFNASGDTSIILVGKHGVDSTVNMNVTVLQNTTATRLDTIIENQLPWNYLGFIFTDDITDTILTTQNIAGCDSIITYSLHVYRNVSTFLDSSVCENKLPLVWNGIEFNTALDSSATLIGEHGVDSIVNMSVSVVENPTATIHDTIIENQLPWTYLGVDFTTDISDTTFVIPNTLGCDSLITYSLYVHRNITTNLDSSTCENNLPLIWNGVEFNTSSDSSIVLIGQYGVDSIVNMHVTVLQNSTTTISDTVFEHQLPHSYLDIIFTTDIDTTLVISNTDGCDSIIFYSLHVNRNIYIELDSAVCENNLPFIWYGVEFNHADDTTVIVPVANSNGIDSIITLHVNILPIFNSVEEVYLCFGDSITWIDGNTYYSNTDEPIFILQANNGCDSIINLHLRIDDGKITSRMKVSPTMVTHEQRMVELTDLSEYSSDRIWLLPDMVSTNKICRYEYPIDKDSVEIILIAYNEHECSDTSSTIVRIDGDIFVPNAFTPTQESNNKFFVVTKNIHSINVRIYDRNGGFIYQYETLDGEWDGRRNGQVCPQGSYVYRIEYTTKANPKEVKLKIGTVTLIR